MAKANRERDRRERLLCETADDCRFRRGIKLHSLVFTIVRLRLRFKTVPRQPCPRRRPRAPHRTRLSIRTTLGSHTMRVIDRTRHPRPHALALREVTLAVSAASRRACAFERIGMLTG
eukprot:3390948-Prymnesium_polylepis.1